MAQDITLMGATYLAVPAVLLPTSNGTAQFTDVSDTTASASDVASGKYFYTANGTKTQGSATTPSVQTNRSYTVSGSGSATINPSSGYDAMSAVALTVPSGTATAPSTISGSSASVSTGTNTLTLSKTVSVTPNVSTAGYISSGTAGNSAISLTASVTTKGATTYTPTTTNQTIASGTYLTGTQTISGDANLIAGNIKKDVSIFGVTGTYEGGGGGGLLPSGYTQVDSILSDGTATSQLETIARAYSQTLCQYELTTTASADEAIFGCGAYAMYRSSAGTNQCRNNNGQSVSLDSRTGWHVSMLCGGGGVLGNQSGYAVNVATMTNNGTAATMYIFSNAGSDLSHARITCFKQWNGSYLIHDLIPCLRDSDSAAGFYDIVTDVFYTASGYSPERLFRLGSDIERAVAWGSTWGDWVNSSYNTEGWVVGNNRIERPYGRRTYVIQDRTVSPYVYPTATDLIKNIYYNQISV